MPASPAPTDVIRPYRLDRLDVTPPPRPTAPGFEVLEELGRGGMGVVYRAKQTALNRVVALKMVLAGEQADEVDQLRFLAEAEAVAAVKHSNVVEVYEFGFNRGLAYFAMEYLAGGSLARKLAGCGTLPPDDAVRIVEPIARGVQAAHEVGVVHRDLKPGNILFSNSEPKVADFGLAKRDAGYDLTRTGMVVGTPAYMAPEQATGRAKWVGPAADVYSLGAILYECLTGQPPFRADDPSLLLIRVVSDDPLPIRSLKPDVPRDLELICMKCLAKKPAERYPSAASFAGDLVHFLNREPVSVRPAGRLEKAAKWVRRYPARATIYGLVSFTALLLCLMFGAVYLMAEARVARDDTAAALDTATQSQREAEQSQREAEQSRTDALAASRLAEVQRANAVKAQGEAEAARVEEAKAREALAIGNAYSSILLASREYEVNNVAAMREALDSCRADLRGWEWRYLDKAIRRELKVIPSGSAIRSVEFAPDGRLISCGAGGLFRWDTSTWRSSRFGPLQHLLQAAISADGTRIVLFNMGRGFSIIESESGRLVKTLPASGAEVALSADGKMLGVADMQSNASVFDVATGEKRSDLVMNSAARCIAFDPTGRRIAVGGTDLIEGRPVGVVRLWDKTGQKVDTSLVGHGSQVVKIAYSPDGLRIAAIADDGSVQLWEGNTGARRALIPGPRVDACVLAFSRDGQRLVTGGADRAVRVWDASNATELFTFRGHVLPVLSVAFSPDGTRIVSGGDDGKLIAWDVSVPPDSIRFVGMKTMHSAITATPDGERILATGEAGPPQVFHGKTGRPTWSGDELAQSLRLSLDGKQIRGFTDAGEFREWDLPTGLELSLRRKLPFAKVFAASTDGSRVLARVGTGTIFVLDAKTGARIRTIEGGQGWSTYWAAISPDGKRVVTSGNDLAARVWEVDSAKEPRILIGHNQSIRAVAFSPDGTRIVTGGNEGWVKVWDSATFKNVLTIRRPGGMITAVGFSTDGSRLLVCNWAGVVTTYDAGLELPKKTPS